MLLRGRPSVGDPGKGSVVAVLSVGGDGGGGGGGGGDGGRVPGSEGVMTGVRGRCVRGRFLCG